MSDRGDMLYEDREARLNEGLAKGLNYDDAKAESKKILDDHDDGGSE